jgi:hypothetical protein
VTGRWFSPDSSVSSTNKTNLHDIAEILLKVALNTIKQKNKQSNKQTCVIGIFNLFNYHQYIFHCCFCRFIAAGTKLQSAVVPNSAKVVKFDEIYKLSDELVSINRVCNTTGATSGAGTAYPSGVSEFTPQFLVRFVLLDL